MVKVIFYRKQDQEHSSSPFNVYNISKDQDLDNCARKILSILIKDRYDCDLDVFLNQFITEYLQISTSTTIEKAMKSNSRKVEQCISIIKEFLLLKKQAQDDDIIIKFFKLDEGLKNFFKNMYSKSKHIYYSKYLKSGGVMKKEYIKLQKGGKRIIRYGKRGGKYYMKGGKKVYI